MGYILNVNVLTITHSKTSSLAYPCYLLRLVRSLNLEFKHSLKFKGLTKYVVISNDDDGDNMISSVLVEVVLATQWMPIKLQNCGPLQVTFRCLFKLHDSPFFGQVINECTIIVIEKTSMMETMIGCNTPPGVITPSPHNLFFTTLTFKISFFFFHFFYSIVEIESWFFQFSISTIDSYCIK